MSKKKDRDKVRRLFSPKDNDKRNNEDLLAKIERLNEHFRNRH
nr:MAG TPA: hypothetical protein [Bacteriophage sp.]DAI17962.1 MAG TPA: hypothetical protein [Caudoviricetes sp.]DAJ05751.1 MAG TPA: hypothetical protein [Caudoviricetes sp.]DAJ33956.1 MAG TPA: hypothetical protein [Caudoviricetes sp.]DAJ83888.1 MAG TPA: hypothetical protein [Caudoviricetes sp.]